MAHEIGTTPGSGMELCLACHDADAGSFSEFRAGLDHLEFFWRAPTP
jgi:hypothetical protein